MDAGAADDLQEAALWRRMRVDGDSAARHALMQAHLPYARVVAATYFGRRFNDDVEFDDYLQYARVGLIEAMDRFDPARGVQFRTFAARRMHGAILNGLERFTEKQQQIAARHRIRSERLDAIKAAALEGAGDLHPHPAQVLRYVSEVGIGLALCWVLEGTALVENGEAAIVAPFYRSAAIRQLRERLLAAIETLPAQERLVVKCHYLQEMPFVAVAALLKVTKGRISQIHRQALVRLRALVREHADWSASF